MEQYLPLSEFRAKRRAPRVEALLKLRDEGFKIEQITEYQFRINDTLDYYPTNDKYCIVKTQTWGAIRGLTAVEFIRRHFK